MALLTTIATCFLILCSSWRTSFYCFFFWSQAIKIPLYLLGFIGPFRANHLAFCATMKGRLFFELQKLLATSPAIMQGQAHYLFSSGT